MIVVSEVKNDFVSGRLKSSKNYNGTDDSLKDWDSLHWLAALSKAEREEWLIILEWVRLADRLSEKDFLKTKENRDHNNSESFREFVFAWRKFWRGEVVSANPYQPLFNKMRLLWSDESVTEKLKNLDVYLQSLERYALPKINDIKGYHVALYGLSGTFFQCLPRIPNDYLQITGCLGKLDQFYNHLRDLEEDLARGLSFFPEDLLAQFGLKASSLFHNTIMPSPEYKRMMDYLLFDFEPSLRRDVQRLFADQINFPLCWRELLKSVSERYDRIKNTFISSDYNIAEFTTKYWRGVEQRMNLAPF